MQIITYALTAFVGGLILNIMPCVLPVLTMKVFSVVKLGGKKRSLVLRAGLAYTLGVVLFFLFAGVVVVALRLSGRALGWGMHFQQPVFVAFLTGLIFVFALQALDVFQLRLSVGHQGGGNNANNTFWSDVSMGAFAALMATPCTAPFVSTAAGFAMSQSTPIWQTLVIFATMGLGLAAPFAAVCAVPAFARLLPKPGDWMNTIKKFMGFGLLATAIWLYGVLLAQVDRSSATWFLGFLWVLATALWGYGKVAKAHHSRARHVRIRFALAALVLLAGNTMLSFDPVPLCLAKPSAEHAGIRWLVFDEKDVQKRLSEHKQTLFLDFGAAWCAACEANEKLVLSTDKVAQAFAQTGVVPIKVDLTQEDETKLKWLKKYGRDGLPTYVIHRADGTFDVLPVTITPESVAKALRQAVARKAGKASRQR